MPRKFDIHIQLLPESEQTEIFKFMTFGFDSTIGVKGFQMLINMWLKCFLTSKGGDPSDLSYGTAFTQLIGSNVALDDTRDVVDLAIDQCNTKIKEIQDNNFPLTPSELLESAQLIDFIEDPSAPGFSAYIEIKNKAQERLTINIPVTVGT